MKNPHDTDYPTSEYININACGIIRNIKEDSHLSRPYRNDYQIIYVVEGVCQVRTKAGVFWANAGDVVFYRPGEPQDYILHSDKGTATYWVHFAGTGMDALVDSLNLGEENVLHLAHKREIEDTMRRLCEDYAVKKPHYQMHCNGLLMSVLALLGRYSKVGTQAEMTDRSAAIINEVISTFRTYGLWMSVKHCADYCNLSVNHFSRLFKQVTGENPVKFFSNIRIEYAKHLLTYTDYPISRVSEMSGFRDQNYFARIFKKNTGMTPLQFRKK